MTKTHQQIENLKKQISELEKRNSQLSKDNIELKALLIKITNIIKSHKKQVDTEVYEVTSEGYISFTAPFLGDKK